MGSYVAGGRSQAAAAQSPLLGDLGRGGGGQRVRRPPADALLRHASRTVRVPSGASAGPLMGAAGLGWSEGAPAAGTREGLWGHLARAGVNTLSQISGSVQADPLVPTSIPGRSRAAIL
jgi:hypothetical protein